MLTELEQQETAILVDEFMKTVRRGDEKTAYALKQITLYEHRTNQQLFFKNFIIPLLKEYANKQVGMYDLRNEDTVKFCQGIKEQLEKAYFGFI